MGGLMSTGGRTGRGADESRPAETGRWEADDVGSRNSTAIVDESCAIIGNKSGLPAVDNETAGSEQHEEQEDEFESCDGAEKWDELEEFREELERKRQIRKSKMADFKQKMDQLRTDLSEEKSKNRALIRYIQSQEQTKGSLDLAVITGDESESVSKTHGEKSHADSEINPENQLEQSDSDRTETDTTNDIRLALKKDLADSQLQLQIANGEILSLQSVVAQLQKQIQTLRTPTEEEEAAAEARNKELRLLKAEVADSQFQLQISNAEVLSLQSDISQLKNQIKSLKDVIKAGKEIINIREDQVEKLKAKLRQIEDSLHEREMQIMSADLRREYERQMTNIRNLRELYEERERVSRMERDNLLRQLELRKNDLEAEQEKNKNLESHVASLQADLEATKNELIQTTEKLNQSVAESKQLQAEMTVVNQFISKFLLGMNRKQTTSSVKLDKLAEVLEENRGLLIEMTKEEAETIDLGAFLPRALYDLVAEVDQDVDPTEGGMEGGAEEPAPGDEFTDVQKASPEQIADKLPKVWRVLIELVNHQERAEQVPFVENGESEDCLKSEQTKSGTKTVVSVSKTYLKLKDLILEKNSLKKETNRLKTLNSHLERRLETQEKRLSVVSLELTKTWHLVGKMQRQHRQLHTQEQILRYHLQQKRRLLSELKEELEYCRMKWSAARQKNIESEDQWRMLKADFAARKKQDSLNNSGESGYSDEQPTDDEDEEYRKGDKGFAHSKEYLNRVIGFERFRSASLTNVLQVALVMRKCHSESDMKSLQNVERANQFCNGKIEELSICPEEEPVARPVKKKLKKPKKKKEIKPGPESAEAMFMRLSGLTQVTNDDDTDESENELSDDSECSEIEKIEQREITPVEESSKEPELTSEELFNMKREARLKRMSELNSRLDNFTIPNTPSRDPDSNAGGVDPTEAGPSRILTSTEEDYLQRRAARLERLEREAREFRNKLSRTVNRGSEISAQIDELHNGFMARQSESPVPSALPENQTNQTIIPELPLDDLNTLTDREREYTQNRSDRLRQLEDQSNSLIKQMNRTLTRGSRLTSQLDLLHSRYGSGEQPRSDSEPQEASTAVEETSNGDCSRNLAQNVEPQVVPQTAAIDEVLMANSIIIPPDGPIELTLMSDEEAVAEMDEQQPVPSNAPTVQEGADATESEDVGSRE
ncbi:restin homolog [Toxorhynchites rutilus septentrionalis]|uniref:restin homolog n=1 Tax=Toxorhynchites rutilus septentrionalis TaxID=329112 RepID=UPI0024792553|nr:restin homolog [Toxorhynchites rutilus septentrionalis]